MYCKSSTLLYYHILTLVLIVAKCIVNRKDEYDGILKINVLIVAKCIVNSRIRATSNICFTVLIVAKCIVNQLFFSPAFHSDLY